MRVHLDTDLGTNPDDACALAYLLAREDVELVGVTTVDDPDGGRVRLVREVLQLAGRAEPPVASGSAVLDAGDLLHRSVDRGAVILGIGPATTLASAERRTPGLLAASHVVLMGGWLRPPGHGLPAWPPSRDTNVVRDLPSARLVRRAAGRLTLVPLAATALTHLRLRDLSRLRSVAPLGALLADQIEAYVGSRDVLSLGRAHPGLPDDLALFLHDPLAAAVATGWTGVALETLRLRTARNDPDGRLEEAASEDGGRDVDLVTDVDGTAFVEHWVATVERLGR